MSNSNNKSEVSDFRAALGDRQVLSNSIIPYVSQQGGEPSAQPVLMTASHDDYVRSLGRQALCSGTALEVACFIKDHAYKSQRLGLSSVYVDKAGMVHLLNPHGHTISAYTAIRDNLPAGYETNSKTLPNSKIDFRDLTRLSGGIMRGQFYPAGVGLSVDLDHPPTGAQIKQIQAYYETIPGTKFLAELYEAKELIGYARTLDGLRRVLAEITSGKHGKNCTKDSPESTTLSLESVFLAVPAGLSSRNLLQRPAVPLPILFFWT